MPKERINITVDPSVKEALSQREDLNVSGMFNQYAKQHLTGDSKSVAAKEAELTQLLAEREEKQEELDELDTQIKRLRDEIERDRERERERLNDAIQRVNVDNGLKSTPGPRVTTPQERLEDLAEGLDVTPEELRQQAVKQHEESQ